MADFPDQGLVLTSLSRLPSVMTRRDVTAGQAGKEGAFYGTWPAANSEPPILQRLGEVTAVERRRTAIEVGDSAGYSQGAMVGTRR